MSHTKHKQLLIHNTSLNLIGHFYLAIASLITIPIFLKHLGVNTFAILALVNTTLALTSLLHLGLHQATIRFLSLHRQPQQQSLFTLVAVWLNFLLSFGLIFIGLVLKPTFINHFHLNHHLFWLIFNLVLANYLTNFFNIFPQIRNDFAFYNLKTFIVGTSNTILAAYIAIKFHSLETILLTRLIAQFITLVSLLTYFNKHFASPNLNLTYLSNNATKISHALTLTINYSLKKFLGLLSSQGVFHFPRLFIATYLPLNSLALFTIPQGLVANLQASLSQLTLALFPLSTTLLAQQKLNSLRKIIRNTQLLIFFIASLVTLIVWFFAQPLLNIWLHNPTLAQQITPIFKILTLAYSISSLSAIPATLLDSLGKPEIPTFFSFLNLVLQIFFLFLLKPHFGLLAVPLSILAHTLIQVPLFLIYFSRQTNLF